MEYFAIMTLHTGTRAFPFTMTVTAPSGATRASLYHHVRTEATRRSGSDADNCSVTFFSAEPNTLALASR